MATKITNKGSRRDAASQVYQDLKEGYTSIGVTVASGTITIVSTGAEVANASG